MGRKIGLIDGRLIVAALITVLIGLLPTLCQAQPAPQIVSTSPAQNQLNLPIYANISITFDMSMDVSTIHDTNIVVAGRCTGWRPGIVSYDYATNTATYNPVDNFAPGEVVTVVVTPRVESASGIQLDTGYSWSFTVEAEGGSAIYDSSVIYAAGAEPTSLVAAELDGNRGLDLAVASAYDGEVATYFNNGAGVFSPGVSYSVGFSPYSVVAGDIDADGDVDLAAAVESSEYFGWVAILLNHGDGTFGPILDIPTTGGPIAVCVVDLDGDGDLDLATANDVFGDVSVLFNNGDSTFSPGADYPVGPWPLAICSADLDGDGDADLATAKAGGDVTVLFNNGAGLFVIDSMYQTGQRPYSVTAADLDGDGDLDLVTCNEYPEYMPAVAVLLNNGDGTFAPYTHYYVGGVLVFGRCSVFPTDVDGDGDLDLATSSSDVSVLLNDGNAHFTVDDIYTVGSNPWSIFGADFDGDHDMDLATTNWGSDNISILFNHTSCDCSNHGDVNGDSLISAIDVTYMIYYVFRGGPPPPVDPFCPAINRGDFNCDNRINVLDIVYYVNYVFRQSGMGPCNPCEK